MSLSVRPIQILSGASKSVLMNQSNPKRSSRPRPVSCHFCRSKKLRCSRHFPCPNCTTRGINCQLYASPEVLTTKKISKQDAATEPRLEVLARLQRLEDIVLGATDQTATEIADGCRRPHVETQAPTQPRRQPATTDAEWLESECVDQSSSNSIHPDKIVFRKCPVQEITKFASYVYQSPDGPFSPREPTKCIWIPYHEESKILVEKYLNDITYIHHVVHLPSVRVLINNLYEDLDQQQDIKPGQMALLLSILASATYSWMLRDASSLFSTVAFANAQSTSWVEAALEVLEYSRRTTSGALEDIQAMIILSFVITSLEGTSPVYRNLISTAITCARGLSLHRIDHPSNSAPNTMPLPDSVHAEIGRRVWWYLAATDWMLSRYAGAQEGVYTISPRHMVVNKPRNINDEELVDGVTNVELPLSQPTSMSYFLQRIRIAEIWREFTDRVPLRDAGAESTAHSQIMELDAKIDKFVEDIPAFFCLDGGSLEEIAEMDLRRAPDIIIQRYILNSLVHAQRCKLHVHSLARGAVDPAYARSREICLQSARTVIRTERLLEMEDIPFVSTRLKFSGVLYCVFMAVIVLLLDVCFNKNAAHLERRKAEVVDAYGILEEARGQSKMVAKLLDSLMSVLRKHQVSIPSLNGVRMDRQLSSTEDFDFSTAATNNELTVENRPNHFECQNFASPELSYFDEIWQSLEDDIELFSELDTQFM